jgi:SnoaL-like protein
VLILEDGTEILTRSTAVFHREDGEWKMVQGHTSVGISNEDLFGSEPLDERGTHSPAATPYSPECVEVDLSGAQVLPRGPTCMGVPSRGLLPLGIIATSS